MPSPTPPRFTATATVDTDVVLLTVVGEIDLDTADELEAALAGVRSSGLPIVVDLLACPFMDSTGLQRLLSHREAANADDLRTVVVYEDAGTIARLVDLVAPGLFETASSVDAARSLVSAPAA